MSPVHKPGSEIKKKKKRRRLFCTFSSAIWLAIASSPSQLFFLKNPKYFSTHKYYLKASRYPNNFFRKLCLSVALKGAGVCPPFHNLRNIFLLFFVHSKRGVPVNYILSSINVFRIAKRIFHYIICIGLTVSGFGYYCTLCVPNAFKLQHNNKKKKTNIKNKLEQNFVKTFGH